MKLHLLGTRGSMPTGAKDFIKYGADTSSYLLTDEDDAVFLDAGTGICNIPKLPQKRVSIFLTHLHLDHIMGLPFFPCLNDDMKIDIYSSYEGGELETLLERVFAPPFWPVSLSEYRARVSYKTIFDESIVGNFKIKAIPGCHPGGSLIYLIENSGKSICYATDYEHGDLDNRLIEFAKNTDILIYDGQYFVQEYEKYKGFGHSTKERGIEIANAANVKSVIFTHHDPRHTDEMLFAEEKRMKKGREKISLAKQGEVIEL